jgi:hypothetical protein
MAITETTTRRSTARGAWDASRCRHWVVQNEPCSVHVRVITHDRLRQRAVPIEQRLHRPINLTINHGTHPEGVAFQRLELARELHARHCALLFDARSKAIAQCATQ